jgi:hypothetical protein
VSWHTTRVVPIPDNGDAPVEDRYQPACVTCDWTGQEWQTEIGAAHEADFHREHPALSGEHAAITEENEA